MPGPTVYLPLLPSCVGTEQICQTHHQQCMIDSQQKRGCGETGNLHLPWVVVKAGGEQILVSLYCILPEISSQESNDLETLKKDEAQGAYHCIAVVGCLGWSPFFILAKGFSLLALNNLPQ